MSRLIDADLIQYEPMLSAKGNGMYEDVMVAYKSQIDDLPTIERKKGKWIDETFKPWGLVHHPYKCNQCGEHSEADLNFCPNCGSEMRRHDEGTADDI